MKIDVWCQTDVGLKRENNQDTFLIDPDRGLYIVADGMGGHQGGEVASALAVKSLQEVVTSSFEKEAGVHPREVLERGYRVACERIYDQALMHENLKGMGTTMVGVLLRDGIFYIANVGDSRAYLYSPPGFWQITEDHSLINEQIRMGALSEEQAKKSPAKNVITRSVGYDREVQADIIERRVEPNEMILICSDGLSGMVTDKRIEELCKTTRPADLVGILVEEAKKNGGDDNVTVMILYSHDDE
jgi:serine/threonine protein phosphatase PrpC